MGYVYLMKAKSMASKLFVPSICVTVALNEITEETDGEVKELLSTYLLVLVLHHHLYTDYRV